MIDPTIGKRTLFREVNERIRDVTRRFGVASGSYEFFCECTQPDCLLRVELPGEIFDEIVADGRRFLLAEDHEERALTLTAA